MRLTAGTRRIRIHTEDRARIYASKYARKLGSLRRAEPVADRRAEEKTELGGLIYGYKFSSGRGSGNTIQAQFSTSSPCPSPGPFPPPARLSLLLFLAPRSSSTSAAVPSPPPGHYSAISRNRGRGVKTYERVCTASITRADETWHERYGGAMKMR